MNTLIQQYLLTHSFADLERDHAVHASRAGHKWSLNYDQIAATDSDLVAQQCRGIVLARVDGSPVLTDTEVVGQTVVLARPFDRFFNYGQGSAVKIDFSLPTVKRLEKPDGTLGILYFDIFMDQWCLGTRSVSNADVPMNDKGLTFRMLFEKCLFDTTGLNWNQLTGITWKENTYLFEITSPDNQVVIPYDDYRLTLLGIRNTVTGEELCNHLFYSDYMPVPSVKTIDIPEITLEGILEMVNAQNPVKFEGCVVVDTTTGQRVKIKHPGYVNLSHIKNSIGNSERRLLQIVLTGKEDDVKFMLPVPMQEQMELFKVKLVGFVKTLTECINSFQGVDRKTVALECQAKKYWITPVMNILFPKKPTDKSVQEQVWDYVRKQGESDSGTDYVLKELSTR